MGESKPIGAMRWHRKIKNGLRPEWQRSVRKRKEAADGKNRKADHQDLRPPQAVAGELPEPHLCSGCSGGYDLLRDHGDLLLQHDAGRTADPGGPRQRLLYHLLHEQLMIVVSRIPFHFCNHNQQVAPFIRKWYLFIFFNQFFILILQNLNQL